MRSRVCVAAAILAAAAFASPSAQPRVTTPKAQLGFDFGDDYQLANYQQIADYWRKLDAESDRMVAAGDRQDGRRAAAPDGDRHLAGQPQESRAVHATSRAGSRSPRASPTSRRARSRRKAKRSSGSTAGCTRPKRSARSSSAEMVYQMVSRTDAETLRFLDECIVLFVHANPGRQRPRRGLVHAQPRSAEAQRGRPAAALSEVHRPRQQPRLLRVDAGRDREHQPRALPRVAAADSLQPSPERPGRHRRLVLAAARSVQLQPRSAADPRAAGARHAHAPAAGRRGQAGRDHGVRRARTTAGGTAASATPATSTTSSPS